MADGLTVVQLKKILDDLINQGRGGLQVDLVVTTAEGNVTSSIFKLNEQTGLNISDRLQLFMEPDALV